MTNGPEDTQFRPEDAAPGRPDSATPQFAADPELEQLLREALRPEEPYTGFADRVLSRIAEEDAPVQVPSAFSGTGKLLHWPQSRLWITGAVAAALIVGLFEGEVAFHRAREQQRRILEATQQFQTTERVTVHALAQAREQLQRAGVPLSLD